MFLQNGIQIGARQTELLLCKKKSGNKISGSLNQHYQNGVCYFHEIDEKWGQMFP